MRNDLGANQAAELCGDVGGSAAGGGGIVQGGRPEAEKDTCWEVTGWVRVIRVFGVLVMRRGVCVLMEQWISIREGKIQRTY